MSTSQSSQPSVPAAADASDSVRLETELEKLKQAVDADPDSVDLNRGYSKALILAGRLEEALACWYRIEQRLPQSAEPVRRIAKLIIALNRQRAFHPGASANASSLAKEKGILQPLDVTEQRFDSGNFYRTSKRKEPPKRREIALTDWQKLEHAVDENPADIKLYLELSDLYLEAGREYDAERLLTKGRHATDDDIELRARWEQVKLLRFSKKLEAAERRVAVEETPSARDALTRIQREYQELVLEILGGRCERNPENAALRFELATRLKHAGNYEQAIKWLQEAADDPRHKPAVYVELGECLHRLQKYPEALQYYRQAVDLAGEAQQLDCKKLALYRAGVLAAGIKLVEPAKRYLGELLQIDASYKDAAEKLRELA